MTLLVLLSDKRDQILKKKNTVTNLRYNRTQTGSLAF